MGRFFLILLLTTLSLGASPLLHEKLSHAEVGAFIVTSQEGHYSLLTVRSLNYPLIVLEEISIPCKQIDSNRTNWKEWVQKKAPGHTSWILYEIDLAAGKLRKAFSVQQQGWLDASDHFLTRLLTLPLSPILERERKKIGTPSTEIEDHRPLWNPPLIREGKKLVKAPFQAFRTTWPEERSPLSLCEIELYFAKELPTFPFPFWIEVHSPHYTLKVRTVDSGAHLLSPLSLSVMNTFSTIPVEGKSP
jgi:hypothetical protein